MNDELTYEEALDTMAWNTHITCKKFWGYDKLKDELEEYKSKTYPTKKDFIVSYYDYLCLKKLEEAIEKAKKYDELAKEKE